MVKGQRNAVIESVNTSTHVHGEDHKRIDAAVRKVARANEGLVDPNLVRDELTSKWGLTVEPRVLSARYMFLRGRKIIDRAGTIVNRDAAGRNQGKPMWLYEVTNTEWLGTDGPPFVWDIPLFPAEEGTPS